MRSILGGIALTLAACAGPELPDDFRDTSVPITSSTRLDLDRFIGNWFVVAEAPSYINKADPFRITKLRSGQYQAEYPDGHHVDAFIWSGGNLGRFEARSSNNKFPVWVLWVDEDHRTIVLGNPSGSFGQILNRTPTLREDRLQAAKDILKFNGYDLSQLKKTPQ